MMYKESNIEDLQKLLTCLRDRGLITTNNIPIFCEHIYLGMFIKGWGDSYIFVKTENLESIQCEDYINSISLKELIEFGMEIEAQALKNKLGEELQIKRNFRYIPEVSIIMMDTVYRQFYSEDSDYIKTLDWMNNKFLNTYYNSLASKPPVDTATLYTRPLINQLSIAFKSTVIFTPPFSYVTLETMESGKVYRRFSGFDMTGSEYFRNSKVLEAPFVPLGTNSTDVFSETLTGYLKREQADNYTLSHNINSVVLELHKIPDVVDKMITSLKSVRFSEQSRFLERYMVYTNTCKSVKYSNELLHLNWLTDYVLLKIYDKYLNTINLIQTTWTNPVQISLGIRGYSKSKQELIDNLYSVIDSNLAPHLSRNVINNCKVDIVSYGYLPYVIMCALNQLR